MAFFANIIIDISQEKLDRPFQYKIPDRLYDQIIPGTSVLVPFGRGNTMRSGFVLEITEKAEFEIERIKEIAGITPGSVPIESQLIALASWMHVHYGSTMNQALKTVLPIKKQTRQIQSRSIKLLLDEEMAKQQLEVFIKKNQTARARLLSALLDHHELKYEMVTQKLNVSTSVIQYFNEQKLAEIISSISYRNPVEHLTQRDYQLVLNEEQTAAVDLIMTDYNKEEYNTYLIHGITGSGKTEVYMELIAQVILQGRQAIVLIPEIALTYQTVMRFYDRFGDRVSIMNSKLSQGERYDQFERAKKGEIDIVIGPRSALFTPFAKLGIIIIDEEHESTYKSEPLPRYHARETGIERARMANASVILGSATPSIDSYYRALQGEYKLIELLRRGQGQPLPSCQVIDLRQELREGNRSILSLRLQELIADRLQKKQQIMLFLNRRGVSGFISCRACGHVMKCPHCDVSLSLHNNNRLVCHYCGHDEAEPASCPACGSKYITGFKAGTQKIEEIITKLYPQARVLRMDFDTTRTKNGYEKILSEFANQEADILVGTQMIVKGHDFSNVTLVGILAADMSLYVNDYRASERTFQLLTQAAGRAGRGGIPGEVVVQTYTPDHYSITTAKSQDYKAFYQEEMHFRALLSYPPVSHLLLIVISGKSEETVSETALRVKSHLEYKLSEQNITDRPAIIGPADASIFKISDIYRKVIYCKHYNYQLLIQLKDWIEEEGFEGILFDFDPMHGF
ncbi:MAG: primosomal protein N' [Lachnospiraceae bacterium]